MQLLAWRFRRGVALAWLVLPFGMALHAPELRAEGLFQFDGKTYSGKDLKSAEQQAAYDIELDHFAKLQTLAQMAVLNQYFDAEAKRTGKTRAQVEEALAGVSEPTEKEINAWFEANKARIPPGYTVDKISGEIKTLLKDQGTKEKKDALLAKLKKDKRFTFLVNEPEAPQVDLNLQGFPVLGDAKAKITIAEFADYQCPHCKVANPALEAVVKKYSGKVKLVFLDYPIKGEFSQLAAYGAYCAGLQDKFWPYHDLAYDKQATLGAKDAALALAKELKLDEAKFNLCLASDAAKAHVARGKAEGDRVGLSGTPLIFINNKRIKSYDGPELDKIIAPLL